MFFELPKSILIPWQNPGYGPASMSPAHPWTQFADAHREARQAHHCLYGKGTWINECFPLYRINTQHSTVWIFCPRVSDCATMRDVRNLLDIVHIWQKYVVYADGANNSVWDFICIMYFRYFSIHRVICQRSAQPWAISGGGLFVCFFFNNDSQYVFRYMTTV